jgi:drug/metabolite transporter (DMT)-like permease
LWLALLLLVWSANFIFVKLAVRELPLSVVVAWRYLLAGVVMAPTYARMRRREAKPLAWTSASVLLAVGLLGLVGNQVLFVAALSMTSIAHGAVICAASPILVLLGAAALGQERITPRRAAGMLAAAAGIVLLQAGRAPGGDVTLAGDLLMLASAVVFAAFNIAAKPLAARFGSLTVNAFGFIAAGVLAAGFILGVMPPPLVPRAGILTWVSLIYMAAGTSVAGYLIYTHALRHMPASRVAVLVYLQPVLAILLGLVLLGERPGVAFLPAAAMVLGGVYIVERMP